MIRLKNLGQNQIDYVVTRVPFSASQKSPNPTEVNNPENPTEKIKNPAMVIASDRILIRPGETVEFDGDEKKAYNDEQGAYLYATLGTTELGGTTITGQPILNKNFLIEVDKDGNEVRDNLFIKFRGQNNIETAQKVIRVQQE